MSADCLFCKFATGDLTVPKLHADDLVFAIRDINPQAPTHILVIPNRHVVSAAELGEADAALLGRIASVAASVAKADGLDNGWRVVTNVGPDAGQSVRHLHYHVLGGRPMTWPPG